MSYSLEFFVRSYSAAVQSMWEKLAGLERITKPPRRTGGFDEDAAAFHPYDTPNPTEPGLDDSELIGVRGLLQERYNPNFAGAAASLVDGQPSPTQGAFGARNPSIREDKQRDEVTSLASVKSPADPHETSPAASTAGDPSPTIASAAPQCAVDGEGSSADSGIPQPPAGERTDDAAAEWIGGAVPVISAVLAKHRPAVDYTGVYCNTNSGDGPHDHYENWAAWHAHVAPLIACALAPQPKPAFPETGLDMGARLDGASEMFPQHTRHQK